MQRLRTQLWHLRKGGVKQLRQHRQRQQNHHPSPSIRAKGGRISFEPWPQPLRDTPRRALTVGVILDDFSSTALAHEWHHVALSRDAWEEELENSPIDLLFVESAWHGNQDSWQYCLTGPKAPNEELRKLVARCQEHKIPTVFWNKEDPIHFEDFLPTAKLFDYVFTTDSNQVSEYTKHLGHNRVEVLPFAAQERIHNPVRPAQCYHSRDVCFAGTYFSHRHAQRREQMDLLLNAALDVSPRMEHGLEIFSRFLGEDSRYQFPGELGDRVVGSLDYQQMLTAYRMYKVFLNVNTVVDSPSMCARRIFEITASGTPVVTTPSEAIDEFFDDSMVTQVSSREEAGYVLRALVNSPLLRDVQTHKAQRQIWSHHTYNHRVNTVLERVGLAQHITRTAPSVSMLVSTNRPGQLEHVIKTAGEQKGVEHQLLILTHGFRPKERVVADLVSQYEAPTPIMLYADADLPLGACLNTLADAADCHYSAKIDDDDLYGEFYLADQAYAMGYSQADLVGKQAHFIHLENQNLTALHSPEREHRYTDFVPGPTFFSKTETIRELQFPELFRGEDTGFLQRLLDAQGKIYSADRFQFMRWRERTSTNDAPGHTWDVSDWHLLANSHSTQLGVDTTSIMI